MLILDEATSALTSRDVETVYALLADLKAQGVASIFISHRMHEVEALCDTLSVFRNGRHIETFAKGARTPARDRPPDDRPRRRGAVPAEAGPPAARRRCSPSAASPGRTASRASTSPSAAARSSASAASTARARRSCCSRSSACSAASRARSRVGAARGLPGLAGRGEVRQARIALVPEDRKTEGLMLARPIADNLLAASFARVSRGPFIDEARARAAIDDGARAAPDQDRLARGDPVATLSGGNQQKVVIAKWLMVHPDLILLNDPTRGIDVGTKQELYRLMRELADEGKAILFYSTDYAELIGCCDRVSVLYDGAVVAELEGDALTEEALVAAALNLGAAA